MIIPAKYQHLDLTSDEKNLLRKLEKQLRVEDILVLQVNPFGEVDSRFFFFYFRQWSNSIKSGPICG
jgi:hypothetical protein